MSLEEHDRTDCRILATDISTTALARARRGWYSERELRGLSAPRRDRFFQASEGGYEVVPSLRRLVAFTHHNLTGEAPPVEPGACFVAFCRNVLIYLTDDEIKSVLDRVALALGPGGHLFLGYSESLWRLPSRFALRRLGETFVYQVANRAAAPLASLPPEPLPSSTSDAAARETRGRPVTPLLGAEHYLERGQAATAVHDLHGAVIAFRKASYLRPDDAGIALHLAFALESLGDVDGARPWFRRALDAMALSGPDVAVLEGWSTPELSEVLQRKVATLEGGR
jgi:chemotaxis protein methyltransferase CheR